MDVSHLLRSKKRQIITGVSFFTDKRQYHFFDADRQKLQEDLERRLPGYEVVAADGQNMQSKDETRVLVRTYSDKSLGAYYYYDRLKRRLPATGRRSAPGSTKANWPISSPLNISPGTA